MSERLTLPDGRFLVLTDYPNPYGNRTSLHWWLTDDEGAYIRQLDEFEEMFVNTALSSLSEGWVSVEERLPSIDGEDVLVCTDAGFRRAITPHDLHNQIAALGSKCLWRFWRDLPAPPVGKD